MPISDSLLDILVCPQCHQPLEPGHDKDVLICVSCTLQYPVRDEIPIMLVDEAEPHLNQEQQVHGD